MKNYNVVFSIAYQIEAEDKDVALEGALREFKEHFDACDLCLASEDFGVTCEEM
jgi:hypothetical protein